tara:strand:- start:873 stop:998 length:126 start_codon:yes stop_codon:yes gene_type:complete
MGIKVGGALEKFEFFLGGGGVGEGGYTGAIYLQYPFFCDNR